MCNTRIPVAGGYSVARDAITPMATLFWYYLITRLGTAGSPAGEPVFLITHGDLDPHGAKVFLFTGGTMDAVAYAAKNPSDAMTQLMGHYILEQCHGPL
jgi:hypothetical protein